CEQRPARCSGFTLRTGGGAPTINTRLSCRSTRPGCEQGPARCSGFTLRIEGGAPTINTRFHRRSTRPGCEQRLARCSGFTLRTGGGAPCISPLMCCKPCQVACGTLGETVSTINTRLLRRSTRPGCERGD